MSEWINQENQEDAGRTASTSEVNSANEHTTLKRAFTKKRLVVCAICAVVLIAALVIVLVATHESYFEKTKNEVLQIAGTLHTGDRDDYFMIDTRPETYANDYRFQSLLPEAQTKAIKAIKYANEAFGFDSSVYDAMMQTNSLMGMQTAENEKYKITWTYHPDKGLEVKYYDKK